MLDEVSILFRDVADLSPAERERYFEQHDVPKRLRIEVESLLRFDAPDAPLVDLIGSAAEGVLQSRASASEGLRCGPYRLERLLGRGGMGEVFLAERADGQIRQRVAVKLLRESAPIESLRDRFLQERQILASLQHPGIARLLDAGETAEGRPYLAMDYIDGVPIDEYTRDLDLQSKLLLFLKVCDAVSYAHRNLIVHRDIKPSNILISSDGEPKLLDFGIAKILDAATDQTRTQERRLTPDYASPEQVRGASQTTATDVYSLGGVLYRLLTGRSPHAFPTTTPEAIDAAICSTDPAPASRLNPALPADLDFIVLKALRKEPEERYTSVEALAGDIRAFLEWRPVRARSGDRWYRARKFVRRYWMPVAAAAFVIASLSAGLYVANRQRLVAEHRFSQLRQLAHQVIFDSYNTISGLPDAIDAQTKLVATATQFLAGLGSDATRDKQLALEVAESYIKLARLQGVPTWNNLGQYAEAVENLRKAEALLDPIVAANPGDRYAIYLSANAAHDRAIAAEAAGQPGQMIAEASKVRERFDQLVRLGNLTRKEINAATYIYASLADRYIHLHRFQDAMRYARAGIDISRTNSTVSGPRAETFSVLATALKYSGDFQGALEANREARSEFEKYRRNETELPEHYDARYARLTLSEVRSLEGLLLAEDGGVDLNQPRQAEVLFREAFDAVQQNARNEPKQYQSRSAVAECGLYLGNVLRDSSPKEALDVYDDSLMRIREVPSDIQARRQEASLLAASSYAARRLYREADARNRIDAAFRLLRDTRDYPAEIIKPGSEADRAVRALADHYAGTGQTNQAIEAYRDLRGKVLKSNPDAPNDLLNAAQLSRLDATLAGLLRRAGRADEAAALDQNRLELWRQWDRKLPNHPFVQRQLAMRRE